MLTQNDLKQKFRMVPGQVSVMYYPMNPVSDAVQVDGARIQDIKGLMQLVAAGVGITYQSKHWILPAVNMEGVDPQLGDKIDDGSQSWRVVGADKGMMAGVQVEHKLICNPEAS